MEIILTQWALDAYLTLCHEKAFTADDFKSIIRPDVMKLKVYPDDPKFSNPKFWSVADTMDHRKIQDGFKMKWHNMGDGRVQLRLLIGLMGEESFLCEAYVKNNEKTDRRFLAKHKVYLALIRQGRFTIRGKLR